MIKELGASHWITPRNNFFVFLPCLRKHSGLPKAIEPHRFSTGRKAPVQPTRIIRGDRAFWSPGTQVHRFLNAIDLSRQTKKAQLSSNRTDAVQAHNGSSPVSTNQYPNGDAVRAHAAKMSAKAILK